MVGIGNARGIGIEMGGLAGERIEDGVFLVGSGEACISLNDI